MIATDEGRGDYERRDDYARKFGGGGGGITDVCASLRALPGYSAGVVQFLMHDEDGNCRWVDAADCDEVTGY